MFKDYYQILEISQQASLDEIKKAYRYASKKWHPDLNHGVDTTKIMQDINEAYAILKDETRRKRYDAEYVMFNQKKTSYKQTEEEHSVESTWSYDYEIKDEDLKNDIYSAQQYAKELVDVFLSSLKENSKKAVKGAWDEMKGYLLVAIILSIIGLIVVVCSGKSNEAKASFTQNPVDNKTNTKAVFLSNLSPVVIPKNWVCYEIDGSFSIAVPPTVELRHEYDTYTKQLDNMNLRCNKDVVVFQQKNLSKCANDNHYCRIMFQHITGNYGDFFKADEQETLDEEWRQFLTEMVKNELFGQQLLGTPSFKWINVNEKTKAIEIIYRRNGNNNHTTHVTIYLLQNYNEMVKMIVSYREQEKDLWMPDLGTIIYTFKWNK